VIRKLKKLTIQMLVGANVATIVLMLLTGYSDRLYPVDHPVLSTLGMVFPFFLLVNVGFLLFWLLFKWTKAWVPVVGFCLAYVPIRIYMPIHGLSEQPEDAIKLVSYNVCAFSYDGGKNNRFEDVCEYLREQKPDIVCLQEDVETWRHNEFSSFEKTLAYNDTVELHHSAKARNCLGIHTRFPILRRERIPYESACNGSAAWWLKVGKDTVIVINNHFESCHLNKADRRQYQQILKGEMGRDSVRSESRTLLVKLAESNAKRAPQIDRVCQYVKDHPGYPVIVCGDFNDNPISYSRHAMSQLLTDCYVESGRGIGLSYNQNGFFFRIDHLFCSENIQPYNCRIDDKIDASDHYPLVCWLKIGSKP